MRLEKMKEKNRGKGMFYLGRGLKESDSHLVGESAGILSQNNLNNETHLSYPDRNVDGHQKGTGW